MRKIDRLWCTLLAVILGVLGYSLEIDYSKIASEGLTLSSIVLAVYVAAIIGLINTDLAKKMAKTLSAPKSEFTQLGQLTVYFRQASAYAIATIVISSIFLLIPELEVRNIVFDTCMRVLSILGLIVYALNLLFLGLILRFMLNRQIWNA